MFHINAGKVTMIPTEESTPETRSGEELVEWENHGFADRSRWRIIEHRLRREKGRDDSDNHEQR